MKENIWGRLGYWAIIIACIFVSVLLEVQNREYAYANLYLKGSVQSLYEQNGTLKIVCQNLMDTLKKNEEKTEGPI